MTCLLLRSTSYLNPPKIYKTHLPLPSPPRPTNPPQCPPPPPPNQPNPPTHRPPKKTRNPPPPSKKTTSSKISPSKVHFQPSIPLSPLFPTTPPLPSPLPPIHHPHRHLSTKPQHPPHPFSSPPNRLTNSPPTNRLAISRPRTPRADRRGEHDAFVGGELGRR